MTFKHLVFSSFVISMVAVVDCQIISTPCTGQIVTSFTPCVNFLTNSSSNGGTSSPTEDCCSSVRIMMANATNCLCLILTGGIPFQMPMNPNIAMSLPSACNMPGVPLKCKAPSPPMVVAPGPLGGTTTGAPTPSVLPISPPRTPKDSAVPPPSSVNSEPPADEIPALTPPADSSPPVTNTGSQTPITPSAASSLGHGISPLFLLATFGAIALSLY